ncbi:MAG: YfhO family protein [Verrucomicrobiae bacterium]|nr:YfhO family protein [Verrucomicrobiae bacterium]
MAKPGNAATESLGAGGRWGGWGLAGGCVLLVVLLIFARSFTSDQVMFSNDGPLGGMSARFVEMPGIFFGVWNDLYWVGGQQPSASPTFTSFILYAFGPVGHLKWYAPLAILFAGLCGAFFARRLGGNGGVMALAGLAAALNANFFSYACWGLAARPLTLGVLLLGLAALWGPERRHWLIKTVLAGFTIGVGLMESYDVGAIFSLYLAAFAFFLAIIDAPKPLAGAGRGLLRVGLLAVCAAIMAAHTLSTLIGTQIKGVAGMEQTRESVERRWDEATQWSLPKAETLRILIPGLYGYRMDTPDGGAYWGTVGQTPGWEEHRQGWPRYSGAGEYAGVLVVLVAVWALAQALRGEKSVFEPRERKIVLFWAVAALISILLAWGRHAPFYRLIYALPYFSTIRNPIKFTHPFHLSVIVLFTLGLVGVWRAYLARAAAGRSSLTGQVAQWWRNERGFEKRFCWGLAAALGISGVGFLMFAAGRKEKLEWLTRSGFDAQTAAQVFSSSLGEIGWYLLFLGLAGGLAVLVMSRALSGPRAGWAFGLALAVLVADMARANAPWVIYYNYKERLASHPVLDILRDKPHEHRVKILPFRVSEAMGLLQQVYQVEWAQHQFPYFNIQTLDIVQEPRRAVENVMYREAFEGTNLALLGRMWELTNTRYLLGMAGNLPDLLNQMVDPQKRRFRLHTAFNVVPKKNEARQFSDLTTEITTNGPFALIEFTGALPRAKLYPQWQVVPDGREALKLLADLNFDPWQRVLVESAPAGVQPAAEGGATGKVEWVSYAPKAYTVETECPQPAVLLINNKHHPAWKVRVDGQPAELVRANFLMQGVFVPAGKHRVELRFEPPVTVFYVSLASFGVALVLCVWLLLAVRQPEPVPVPVTVPGPGPAERRK